MPKKIVYLASDHRGFVLKAACARWLEEQGYEAIDLGTDSVERCDASDYAEKLAKNFTSNASHMGVLICGTGHAMAMTANRHKNIRAIQCVTVLTAKSGREHNDANVLVLGADIVTEDVALECLRVFLSTAFLGGHYAERREKLTALGGL